MTLRILKVPVEDIQGALAFLRFKENDELLEMLRYMNIAQSYVVNPAQDQNSVLCNSGGNSYYSWPIGEEYEVASKYIYMLLGRLNKILPSAFFNQYTRWDLTGLCEVKMGLLPFVWALNPCETAYPL